MLNQVKDQKKLKKKILKNQAKCKKMKRKNNKNKSMKSNYMRILTPI